MIQLIQMQARFVGLALIVLLLCLTDMDVCGQSWVASAQKDGFTLKKVVSDTAVRTGQPFSYTIYFSIPPGATNVTISDQMPASIIFISSSFSSPGSTPSVTVPAVNVAGGLYSLYWAAVPTGCSGSFTITTQFANGVTCNGTGARNNVCLQGSIIPDFPTDICTPYVNTTAIAIDPWQIAKSILNDAAIGGSCGSVTPDTVIIYKVCVYKTVGNTGQMNLVNGVVTDVLPVGAVLQSSTCGATQTGNTVSWNVGSLSATTNVNSSCCTLSVKYPRATFPSGSTITNTAVLTGALGSATTSCGPSVDTSAQTCVELRSYDSARISKTVHTNKQPGCVGKYTIRVCNLGTSSIASFTVVDSLPTSLINYTLGAMPTGLSATLVGNTVTATNTTPLLPGQCRQFVVNFTIPLTAAIGSTISNCAKLTSPSLPNAQSCIDFTITSTTGNSCIHKEVCNKLSSYQPGQTFRYRLRIQNISGIALSGSIITDVLNPNLQYVGNAAFYTDNAWNAPCGTGTVWTGSTIAHNPATNTVLVTLASIPSSCETKIVGSCGIHGTSNVPFYFVEFDVKVADTAALGNIPNKFTYGGGTAAANTSNTEYILVVGTAGFSLEKSVRRASATTYSNAISVAPGESVTYRLGMTVATGSVSLRHASIVDMLPRNNGTNDNFILGPCTSRGSTFELKYAAPFATSPASSPYSNAYTGYLSATSFTPSGAPSPMFVGGCGTPSIWTPSLSTGAENVGFYFGPNAIVVGSQITANINADVISTTPLGVTACNSFAANAAVRHIIGSSLISDQTIGQLESNVACVTTAASTPDSLPCLAPPKDMVGWWTLDQTGYATGSSVQDLTGTSNYLYANFANDGAVVGSNATSVPGKVASAIELDGTSWVAVPDAPSINFGNGDFTVDVWVNPKDTIGIHAIADKRAKHPTLYQYAGYTLFTYGSKVAFQLGDGPLWINYGSTIQLPMNTWSFISVRVDRANATITFDVNGGGGTQSQSFAISPTLTSVTNTGNLRIGGHQFPPQFKHWVGSIDELEIFSRVLDVSELSGIYRAGVSGKCKTMSVCDISPPVVDRSCCNARFTLPSSSLGVIAIDYALSTGSTLYSTTPASISTSPCVPASTVVGATSGTLSYGVPCTSTLNIDLKVSSPTGLTAVTFVVYYANGTACSSTREFACDRPTISRCDRATSGVWPSPAPGPLAMSSRRFTIHNEKIPISPISHVSIVRSPSYVASGRDVSINGGPWIMGRFVPPFTRIPNDMPASTFCSSTASITHDLGFTLDAPFSSSGSVQFVVYHCDGDSCVLAPITWNTDLRRTEDLQVALSSDVPTDSKEKVYASQLRLHRTGRWDATSSVPHLKSLEINIKSDPCVPPSPDCPRIVLTGITGGWGASEKYVAVADTTRDSAPSNIIRSTISQSSGVIEFRNAISLVDSTEWPKPLRVIYTSCCIPDTLRDVQVLYTMYDENHDPIHFDSLRVQKVVLAIQDDGHEGGRSGNEIVGAYPNPSNGSTLVTYHLDMQQEITLELCDIAGRPIVTLDHGWRNAGSHDAQLQTVDQPVGVYILRLRSSEGSKVLKLNVVR